MATIWLELSDDTAAEIDALAADAGITAGDVARQAVELGMSLIRSGGSMAPVRGHPGAFGPAFVEDK